MDKHMILVRNRSREEAKNYLHSNTKGIVIGDCYQSGNSVLFEIFTHYHDLEKLKSMTDVELFVLNRG